jgi:hypothetical protein
MSAEPSCEILRLGRDRALCLQRLKLDQLSNPQPFPSPDQFTTNVALPAKLIKALLKAIRWRLPTGLSNSRNAALVCEFPETNTADAELPVDGTRPTAQHATLHLAGGELRRPLGSGDL